MLLTEISAMEAFLLKKSKTSVQFLWPAGGGISNNHDNPTLLRQASTQYTVLHKTGSKQHCTCTVSFPAHLVSFPALHRSGHETKQVFLN